SASDTASDNELPLAEEPMNTPVYTEPVQEIATATTPGLEETPNEMYQRINKQQEMSVRLQPAEKKEISRKDAPKKTVSKKAVPIYENEQEESYSSRSRERLPAEVPAGRMISVTLSENLSSEDESRDGGALR